MFGGALKGADGEILLARPHGGFGLLFPGEFIGFLLLKQGLGLTLGGDALLNRAFGFPDLLVLVANRLLKHEFGILKFINDVVRARLSDFENS